MFCRRLLCLAALSLLILAIAPATAAAEDVPFEVSIGLKGGAMMQGVTDVGEPPAEFADGRENEGAGFFPSFGVGPGAGLSVEGRAWEIVGLETGLYYSLDNATGWVDKELNGEELGRIYSDQESRALHIPLLLKATANTNLIRPFFGLGLEFVVQTDSELDYRARHAEGRETNTLDNFRAEFDENNTIETSNYTLFQLSTGVEIDLDNFRIPVEFRAGYNLGFDDSFEARVEPVEQDDGPYQFIYNGEYLGHIGIFTGLIYNFEL